MTPDAQAAEPRHPNNSLFVPAFQRGESVTWHRPLGKRQNNVIVPTPAEVVSCGPKFVHLRYELLNTIRHVTVPHEEVRRG